MADSSDRAMGQSQEEVRSLVRGLELLRELNRAGSARPGTLARQVGFARPTVYRLLETLEECGFVAKSASDERYRITVRAARLFVRYNLSEEGSVPVQAALSTACRHFPWPLYLATIENEAMVIRLASRSAISLLPARGYTGKRLPLFHTPAGRAYVAACSNEQRHEILRRWPAGNEILVAARMEEIVTEVSSLGYAAGDDDASDPPTASMSIGLTCNGQAVGSLTAVYGRYAIDDEPARAGLFASLAGRARLIGEHLTSESSSRPPSANDAPGVS